VLLRFEVPLAAWILGPSEQSLFLGTSFRYRHCRVVVTLLGDAQSSRIESLPPKSRYVRKNNALGYMVFPESEGDEYLRRLLTDHNWADLLRFVSTVGNRVLRAIRNQGAVPHVTEIRTTSTKPEEDLLRWRVESSDDAKIWTSVVPVPQGLDGIGARFWPQVEPEIEAWNWREIEIALEYDLPARPEQEFTTNSIEFLRLGNLRMAITESVIGLEIVLNRYLKESLMERGIGKKDADDFVSPQLGLSNRVSVLLPLLWPGLSGEVDLNKVRSVVDWRNRVVHKTGNLPEELESQIVKERVGEVVGLTYLLAMELRKMEATPQIREVKQAIANTYKVELEFTVAGQHQLLVAVRSPVDRETMRKIIDEVGVRWSAYDKQFEASRHLTAIFVDSATAGLGRWREGQFVEG
jgi:hypothetical protein